MGKISKALGLEDNGGMECSEDSQGKLLCRKFDVSKGAKIADGSEAEILTDPNTCHSSYGKFSVLDKDSDDFDKIAKKREQACRGGLQ